ncbi:MAG: hypothetical protein KDI82_06795 [Gammaproteobacteria bacterium]|nr:hypothetical protein [Gammaproteobacteria bacterium]
MNLPQGTRGRLVAVALLLIVLILATEFIVRPLADIYRAGVDENFDMRRDITRYRHLLAEKPALEQLAERLRTNDPLAPVTLTGGNPALAAAELQQRLQEAARKNGVRVISLRILESESEGPLERIGVDTRMQTDIRGLRNMLFELETGSPYMFLDGLSIRTRNTRRRQSTGENLDVRLSLHGLRAGANPAAVAGN